MLDNVIQKIALLVAARVTEEVVKRLPDITDAVIELLPDIAEAIIDQILDHLPFPFNRT
jgi:S-adenosylmethionine synthetase